MYYLYFKEFDMSTLPKFLTQCINKFYHANFIVATTLFKVIYQIIHFKQLLKFNKDHFGKKLTFYRNCKKRPEIDSELKLIESKIRIMAISRKCCYSQEVTVCVTFQP